MKKVLLTVATVAVAASVFAQGTVAYYNNGGGLVTRVYGPEPGAITLAKTGNTATQTPPGTQVYAGATLSGSAYVAQFFGANGEAQESALQAATTVNTFRSGSAAGVLGTAVATINAITPDAPTGATLQLRAWDNSSGLYPDWAAAEAAWLKGAIAAGKSTTFFMAAGTGVGGGTLAAGLPVGLTSFNIYFVPEPSTMALAGLGAAAMLIFRRRK